MNTQTRRNGKWFGRSSLSALLVTVLVAGMFAILPGATLAHTDDGLPGGPNAAGALLSGEEDEGGATGDEKTGITDDEEHGATGDEEPGITGDEESGDGQTKGATGTVGAMSKISAFYFETYPIAYELGPGYFKEKPPETYTIEDFYKIICDPIPDPVNDKGFVFAGWIVTMYAEMPPFGEQTFFGNPLSEDFEGALEIDWDMRGPIYFEAQWEALDSYRYLVYKDDAAFPGDLSKYELIGTFHWLAEAVDAADAHKISLGDTVGFYTIIATEDDNNMSGASEPYYEYKDSSASGDPDPYSIGKYEDMAVTIPDFLNITLTSGGDNWFGEYDNYTIRQPGWRPYGSDMTESVEARHLYVSAKGSLTLENITLMADPYKPGIGNNCGGVHNEGDLTMGAGAKITNSEANFGGGVYNSGGFTMMFGAEITDCFSDNGGGVHNSGGFTLKGGEIRRNQCTGVFDDYGVPHGFGGGVYNSGSFSMPVGWIADNSTGTMGGGVYNDEGDFEMSYGEISNNEAPFHGGGVYNNNGTFTMLDGAMIYGNKVTQSNGAGIYDMGGGGVFNSGGSFTMYGGEIIGNFAETKGGGVRNGGHTVGIGGGDFGSMIGGAFNMIGGTISNNSAGIDGGGVWNGRHNITDRTTSGYTADKDNPGGVFTMKGGTISDNEAVKQGGGVYSGDGFLHYATRIILPGGTFNMDDGTISDNKAFVGGGVYQDFGFFYMKDGEIKGNAASYKGGGVYHNEGYFDMSGGKICDNTSGAFGGGVHSYLTDDSLYNVSYAKYGSFVIRGNAVISGNTARVGGGAFTESTGKITMTGGEISGNKATSGDFGYGLHGGKGGGVFLTDGIFDFSGGKISGNIADNDGGGVFSSNWVYDFDTRFTISGTGDISGNKAGRDGGGIYNTLAWDSISPYADVSVIIEGGTITGNEAERNGGGVYITESDGEILSYLTMTGGKITNNTAGGDGGGIFTEDYDYSNPIADVNSAYANIGGSGLIAANVYGNTAAFESDLPSNAGAFTSTRITNKFDGNLLENFNINYKKPFTIKYNPGTQGTWLESNETYNANGGDALPVFGGNTATDHKPGYTFRGWSIDGVTLVSLPLTVTGDVTYTALWSEVRYTVTYNANWPGGIAGTGSAPSDSKSPYLASSTVTVLGNTGALAKENYTFLGWSTNRFASSPQFTAGSTFKINGNTTLFAVWKFNPPPPPPPTPPTTATVDPPVEPPVDPPGPPIIEPPEIPEVDPPDVPPPAVTPPEVDPPAVTPPADQGGPTQGTPEVVQPTAPFVAETATPEEVLGHIVEAGLPTISMGNISIPLAAGTGMHHLVWALVNLILAIAGILLAVATVARALGQRKREKDDAEERYMAEDEEQEKKRRPGWLAIAVVMGIAGIVVFFLTEDMTRLMVLVDNWTIVNAIIFVAAAIACKFAFKREKQDESDENAERDLSAEPV